MMTPLALLLAAALGLAALSWRLAQLEEPRPRRNILIAATVGVVAVLSAGLAYFLGLGKGAAFLVDPALPLEDRYRVVSAGFYLLPGHTLTLGQATIRYDSAIPRSPWRVEKAGRAWTAGEGASVVLPGLGGRLNLEGLRRFEAEDAAPTGGGRYAMARWVRPAVWPLPHASSAPFVIASSDVPGDQPLFHLAAPAPGFSAEGRLQSDGKIELTRGGGAGAVWKAGRAATFGDGQSGVVLELRDAVTRPMAGRTGILFLTIHGLGLVLLLRRSRTATNFDVLSAVLYWLVLSALTVRLVLAARVAWVPPSGAAGPTAIGAKALSTSLTGLLWVPLILLGSRLKAARDRLIGAAARVGSRLPAAVAGIGVEQAPAILVIAAVVVAVPLGWMRHVGAEGAVGLRLSSMAAVLLSLQACAIAAVRRPLKLRDAFPAAAATLLVGAVDAGFIQVYGLAGAVALASSPLPAPYGRRWRVAGLMIAAMLLGWPFAFKAGRGAARFVPGTVVARAAAWTGTQAVALASPEAEASPTSITRNAAQQWQLEGYSDRGAAAPAGYGRGPADFTAVSQGAAATDFAFSIYLLSEHGPWAAILVLLCLVGIGILCVSLAGCLPEAERHWTLSFGILGAIYAVPACYMAAANTGLVVITGKNGPLIGLLSRSNLAEGAFLAALAVGVGAWKEVGSPAVAWRRVRWPTAAFLAGWMMVSLHILRLGAPVRGDFLPIDADLGAKFRRNITGPDAPIRLAGARLELAYDDGLSAFERQEAALRPGRKGGLYALDCTPNPCRPVLDAEYGHLVSPFRPSWHGKVNGRGPGQTLLRSRWVNGNIRRVETEPGVFPLAPTFALAADQAERTRGPGSVPDEIDLPLDLDLQRALQAASAAFYARLRRELPAAEPAVEVTVMDAFTGEVLAAAAAPASLDRNGELANLTNREVGSTIKPLLLSAVSMGFAGEGYFKDIATEAVFIHRAGAGGLRHGHPFMFGKPAGQAKDCQEPSGTMTARSMLERSQNYMAVTLAALGMVVRGKLKEALVPGGREPALTFAGIPYVVALGPEDSAFMKGGRLAPSRIARTALGYGLRALLDDAMTDRCSFLRVLPCDGGYTKSLRPAPITLGYSTLGELVNAVHGGGGARLNSVAMAESAARIVTGRRVTARLSCGPGGTPEPLPAPLGLDWWRERHLFKPMESDPKKWGFGEAVKAAGGPRMRVLAKSGTIAAHAGRPYETEAFMVILGESDGPRFLPGRTITVYLRLKESKRENSPVMRKGEFAALVMPILTGYARRGVAACGSVPSRITARGDELPAPNPNLGDRFLAALRAVFVSRAPRARRAGGAR